MSGVNTSCSSCLRRVPPTPRHNSRGCRSRTVQPLRAQVSTAHAVMVCMNTIEHYVMGFAFISPLNYMCTPAELASCCWLPHHQHSVHSLCTVFFPHILSFLCHVFVSTPQQTEAAPGLLAKLGRVLKEKAAGDYDRFFKGTTKTRERLGVSRVYVPAPALVAAVGWGLSMVCCGG